MANRLFQNTIFQLKQDVSRTLGVLDESGKVIACSIEARIEELDEKILEFSDGPLKNKVLGGTTYRTIELPNKTRYVVFCEGSDDTAAGYCSMMAVHFSSIKRFYDEKYDKNNFVKNIIVDNILPGDVMYRARELHLTIDVNRAVFLVRLSDKVENSTIEIMQSIFPDRNKEFIVPIDERDIVLIKEVDFNTTSDELNSVAQIICDTLGCEGMVKVMIGVSSIAGSIQELAKAYREARVALEVGNVFDIEKSVVNYNNLGIGRLIYQLPTTLCDLFLTEVFEKEDINVLDDETIFTIQKFFENNLNVSETSRKLFVHRNTLVYRLDKIKKLTGLDLREFDDAIVFKVAMMVNKYLITQHGR